MVWALLQEYAGTVVAITHDRYFLDNAAGWILELDRGEGIPWEGNYSSWLEQKDARLKQNQPTESARQNHCQGIGMGTSRREKAVSLRAKPMARFEELNTNDYQNVTKPTSCLFRPDHV